MGEGGDDNEGRKGGSDVEEGLGEMRETYMKMWIDGEKGGRGRRGGPREKRIEGKVMERE